MGRGFTIVFFEIEFDGLTDQHALGGFFVFFFFENEQPRVEVQCDVQNGDDPRGRSLRFRSKGSEMFLLRLLK